MANQGGRYEFRGGKRVLVDRTEVTPDGQADPRPVTHPETTRAPAASPVAPANEEDATDADA